MLKPASKGGSMNRLQKRAPFGVTLLNFVLLPSMKRLTSKDLFVQFIFTRKVIPISYHKESKPKKLPLYAYIRHLQHLQIWRPIQVLPSTTNMSQVSQAAEEREYNERTSSVINDFRICNTTY